MGLHITHSCVFTYSAPTLLSAGWQYPRVWFACEIRQVERQAFIIVPAVHMIFFFYVFLLVILSLGYYFTVVFIARFTTGVLWVLVLAIGEQDPATAACL